MSLPERLFVPSNNESPVPDLRGKKCVALNVTVKVKSSKQDVVTHGHGKPGVGPLI